MGIIYAVVIGGLVGALATLMTRSRDRRALIARIALGIAGAALAYGGGRWAHLFGAGDGRGVAAGLLGALIVVGWYGVGHSA